MRTGTVKDGKVFVTTRQAAHAVDYSPEYVEQLCRKRNSGAASERVMVLDTRKEGNRHYVTIESLLLYKNFGQAHAN